MTPFERGYQVWRANIARGMQRAAARRAVLETVTDKEARMLVRVTSGHFCAGLVLKDARVARAAPILAYMIGWDAERVRAYCQRKQWKATIVEMKRAARGAV